MLTVVCSPEVSTAGMMNRLPKGHDLMYYFRLSSDSGKFCFIVRNNSSEVYDQTHLSQ